MRLKIARGIGKDYGEIIRKEIVINLFKRIKMYKELVLMARETGAYFGESAVM